MDLGFLLPLRCIWCDDDDYDGPVEISDFDAPEVLYSEMAIFPTPANEMRQWVMYYSRYLNDAEEAQACIGRATGTGTPENLVWIDDGKPVYCSNTIFDDDGNGTPKRLRYSKEAEYVSKVNDGYGIDPALFLDDDGKQYLSWGSGVIQLVEVDVSTGHLVAAAQSTEANGPTKDDEGTGNSDAYLAISLGAGGFNEAPYIYKNEDNGYYYLFVNWWACCAGVCSTYEIRVGRSTSGSILGPYEDKDGDDMAKIKAEEVWGNTAAGGTILLQGEGRYVGPGHPGVFDYTSSVSGNNKTVFTFHFYDKDESGTAKLAGREMTFDGQGWPVISSTPWDVSDFM